MQRIRDGNNRVMAAPEALYHFQQLTALAKDLFSDFREVEQNFRKLDRQVREQIAAWDGTQGELLESIFANQQDISSSLQGRTFQGFWDRASDPVLVLTQYVRHANGPFYLAASSPTAPGTYR